MYHGLSSSTHWSRYVRLAGHELAPPSGDRERLQRWPGLLPSDIRVQGDSWKHSSTDVAVAGAHARQAQPLSTPSVLAQLSSRLLNVSDGVLEVLQLASECLNNCLSSPVPSESKRSMIV